MSNSLCNLCVLCVSVVIYREQTLTTETQRTQRLHRDLILRATRRIGCAILNERCIECRCPLDPTPVFCTREHIYRTCCCCCSSWAAFGWSSLPAPAFSRPQRSQFRHP